MDAEYVKTHSVLIRKMMREVREMDENTKWLAVINQKYLASAVGQSGSIRNVTWATQVVQLSLRAGSAKEAVSKAVAWLGKSGIEDAYVSQVCRDGLDEIDVVSVSDSV